MNATKKELFYNTISDVWADKINKTETRKRLRVVFDKLFKSVKLKNKKFLDVGCGLGYFSEEAYNKGAKVTGIDIGANLVNICKKKIPSGKFITASATDLLFGENSFDVVLSTEVIEHVENPKTAVKEIHRVTKKNGFVVLTTPNKLFKPIFSLLSFIKVRPYHGYENWFFPWELQKLLVQEGFTIVKKYYFNFFLPHKYFDIFEKYENLNNLMINQGFLLKKR